MSLSINHSASRAVRSGMNLNILRSMGNMLAITRQRKALADLPEHLLNDIGVTAQEAVEEAGRPAWDVPAYWRG